MKKSLVIILLSILLPIAAHADQVTLKGGQITFETPEGFRELSKEELVSKYPRTNPPSKAYATDDLGVSIAITFSPASLEEHQLEEFKSFFEQSLPRLIPGLVWIRKEVIEFKGKRWVHLELTSSAVDTDVHNNLYITSFHGRMLGFNFNCTKKQYPPYAEALKKSFESIEIKK